MRVLPKIKKPKNINNLQKKFFVFDTETTKLEPNPKNFVFGVVYGWNFKKVIYTIKDFKLEFSKRKYKGCYMFAHNAEFDLSTIYGNIYQNLDSCAIFNGRFIMAKLPNGLTFADSFNIFPSSVAKIGELIGESKLNNKKVKSAKLRKNNITKEDIEYCTIDCKIVYDALTKMFETIGAIKITISSCAMYSYRSSYLKNDVYFSELVDEFYNSYYGGRTEAFKIGKVNSYVYDINSLYPYSMVNCVFPDIKNLKKVSKIDVNYLLFLIKRFEGMAKITVNHKETYFGFLPYKTTKLLFPIGIFETTVNFNELRFALKHEIIEILNVEYAVFGNPIESPFIDFILTNYNLRKNTNDALDSLIYKLKMNSLYGRFAMRKKFKTEYHNLIPFEIINELQKTEQFYKLHLFNQERNDCFLTTENEKFKNSFFSIPTYSSYITSHARITLLENLLKNEKNRVVYCDTDSIFLEKKFKGNTGKELGQFKKENKKVVEVNGLKNYKYFDINFSLDLNRKICKFTKPYKFIIKYTLKGVSKNSIQINENTFKTVQYYKTKESLRQSKETGTKKVVIKTLTHEYDKRIILENGNTKPILLTNITNK